MGDVGEEYEFVLCQLFLYLHFVAQEVEVEYQAVGDVEYDGQQEGIDKECPSGFPKGRSDSNLQNSFLIAQNTGSIANFHVQTVFARWQVLVGCKAQWRGFAPFFIIVLNSICVGVSVVL